jgi:hypothetical protein
LQKQKRGIRRVPCKSTADLSGPDGALAAPLAQSICATAQEEHRDRDRDDRDRRFYDRKHSDYHGWGPHEDAAYRRWQAERHRQYGEFGKLSPSQQQAYWNWRHQHPDAR